MTTQYLHGAEIIETNQGGETINNISTSIIGVIGTAKNADSAKFPLNQPVLITKLQDLTALKEEGALPSAIKAIFKQCQTPIVVVRVEDGADLNATVANAAGEAANYSGVYALLTAESKLGYKPKILIAPLLTGKVLENNKPNALTTNLLEVAEKLRAVAVIDGPNTTAADATAYATNVDNQRAYLIDPFFVPSFTSDSNLPSSSLVAGVIARTDNDLGFWYSPSNKVINGINDLNRPISFAMSDPTSEANLLNEKGVATIIYTTGSYRLWGNKSLSKDQKWQFLNVRRVADTVYDSIEANILWALDMPFSRVLIDTIENNVQTYLNRLKVQGAILNGKVTFPKSINSKEELKSGHVTVDFDFEPPAPMEKLTIRASRNDGYYDEVANSIK